ncbi:starch synthase [Alloyangia pacifica]|uniref:Glycogen synthase n=1 Tax=Alloyangia pacifica TaxID=311180 RepID=A0A2U8HCF3_9RHOB|nr:MULTISPECIES: glycogen synthase GlgA [Roseobacteraceae]AWI83454.1 starch synthase [Alloyangia pacifica]NDV51789.1 glycogen synthase GlgA [Salipiger sp. PrR003]NDW31931.1 glycogen synthase GlgA [Salipiger sp. PrR007]
MTKVLSVASECVPLIKTGGLADVVGALPGALSVHGVDMRVLLPGYRQVIAKLPTQEVAADYDDLFGGPARVLKAPLGDQLLYVLEAPHLFDRDGGPYMDAHGHDWRDNPERFAALSSVAAMIGADGIEGWRPQILHCHDWQAGFVPLYLRELGAAGRVSTLMTIHNIAFQGMAPASRIGTLGLPRTGFHQRGYEFWDSVSALKAGLVYADKLSTVSPTYAAELMTKDFGMGLEGVLRERQEDMVGILNGIDEALWTPPYKTIAEKAEHKAALRKELDLPDDWPGPLCVVISRMTEQKGLDILLQALPALLDRGGQLALLGSGNPGLEEAFQRKAQKHPGVAVRIGYDEEFAHRLMAGGDAILVPSRFEPCGLTQLYGLRYGTLPLVALTGGLADTVINASPAGLAAGCATGLQFHPVTAQALAQAMMRLITLYQDKETWTRMMTNAMASPVSWTHSAAKYAALYQDMVKAKSL